MSRIKNTLGDLNDHLFEQLERLNNDDLTAEELEVEIRRSEAMGKTAQQIISIADLAVKVMRDTYEYGDEQHSNVPRLLEVK